ncbi:MAG: hypothetical protein IPK50_08430 [Fibrobacterota bacterium]|nr:hypothetical protein [Fibrobacterota bacterium]QQS06909.1 MAG: hypothetical protein IPK50_08430 [Fibrobacterota bacterium]
MIKSHVAAVIVLLTAFSGCAIFRPTVAVGQSAPAWSFVASDGGDSVRSSRLNGRPGMLVWMDPLCPQVENASQSGGPLRVLESRWNSTDSAWIYYVAARSFPDAVLKPSMWRPWLKEMKLRGSVLIDTSMSLAHKLGVRTVPTAVVIDAAGKVRWKGPVQGLEREVVESLEDDTLETPPLPPLAPFASQALDSVLAGRPLKVPSLRDTGCSIQETLW